MRKWWIVVSLLLLAGCTSEQPAAGPTRTASALPAGPTPTVPAVPVGAERTEGGCADTPLWTGTYPHWTASAGLPGQTPYVMSHEANMVGVLFGGSLRAGENVTNPSNKILWIVREPRGGASLELTLRRLDGTGEPVTVVRPADSSPGEIYPSLVDVPEPGCWRVDAVWDGHRASLELDYH
jgi:hypothetical protein